MSGHGPQATAAVTPGASLPVRLMQRAVAVEPQEVAALLWSFAYFFCLLCGYYILRPLRDEMGIVGGIKNLPWVFTGTFLVMLAVVPLFGAVAARFRRSVFLPVVYYFFVVNILAFFALFKAGLDQATIARAFFIWVSVFNLFVVSVFWSFMADIFSNAQARRMFGFIAAGGSAGAIAGPGLTAVLATVVGPVNLLLFSAAFLGFAVVCIHRLLRWSETAAVDHSESVAAARAPERPMGGSIVAGVRLVLSSPYLLGIGLFIWLFTTLSTFLYFEQAHIIREAFSDSGERTRVFAGIDLAVNVLTISIQGLLTGRLMHRLGVPVTLALVPALVALGFGGLALAPLLPVLIAFQVARRAGDYALTRPAREVLFTVVGRETKYKAKNFIDTVVYRGGDAIAGWIFAGFKALGLGLAGIAWIAVPIALLWAVTGYLLGRRQEALRTEPGA